MHRLRSNAAISFNGRRTYRAKMHKTIARSPDRKQWKGIQVKRLFLFQACQTHASYNSDPRHRYKLRVIQVNRLTQVNTHRYQVSRTEQHRSYRLEDSSVKHVPYIAIVSPRNEDPGRQASWAHGSNFNISGALPEPQPQIPIAD